MDDATKALEDTCSSRDLAEHFNIPIATVHAAALRGNIPGCVKVLGRYHFNKEVAVAGWTPGAVKIRKTGVQQKIKGGPFKKGNTLGVGNRGGRPNRAVEAKYLRALSDAISPEDWLAIIEKAISQAKKGEWRARTWLSNYLMGTPIQRVVAEVDIKNRRDFDAADRAAAVMALLEEARKREELKIIDVTPKEV